MKFERSWTGNWDNAFHGLRHPMESYAKSDSIWYEDAEKNRTCLGIGPNDMDLAQRMIKAGTPNDKFLRQIFVSVDITAPVYWWRDMDQYKVGTVTNSTSTMHKLASTPITLDRFEIDDYDPDLIYNSYVDDTGDNSYDFSASVGSMVGSDEDSFNEETIINFLEHLRQKYLETGDKRYWKELVRWLPNGWLQTRTWTANYAVLRNIIHWRSNHKLTEWHQFVDWCKTLPYAEELLFYNQSLEK